MHVWSAGWCSSEKLSNCASCIHQVLWKLEEFGAAAFPKCLQVLPEGECLVVSLYKPVEVQPLTGQIVLKRSYSTTKQNLLGTCPVSNHLLQWALTGLLPCLSELMHISLHSSQPCSVLPCPPWEGGLGSCVASCAPHPIVAGMGTAGLQFVLWVNTPKAIGFSQSFWACMEVLYLQLFCRARLWFVPSAVIASD